MGKHNRRKWLQNSLLASTTFLTGGMVAKPFHDFNDYSYLAEDFIPLHWNEMGLPIGSMFVAEPGGEGLLLRIAAQLEEANPWRDRWPAIANLLRPSLPPDPLHLALSPSPFGLARSGPSSVYIRRPSNDCHHRHRGSAL